MRYVIAIAITIVFDIGIVIAIQALWVFFVFFQLLTNAGYAMDTLF